MIRRKVICSLIFLFVFFGLVTTSVYADSSQTGNTSETGSNGAYDGGPDSFRTGWLYYLVDVNTNQQVSDTVGITCIAELKLGGKSFSSIKKLSDTKFYLDTNFGGSVTPNNITIGNLQSRSITADSLNGATQPAYGAPYDYQNGSIVGRGKEVRDYLNKKTTLNFKYKGKNETVTRTNTYWLVLRTWSDVEASKFHNGEIALFFEPFYWLRVRAGGHWVCGTTHSLAPVFKVNGINSNTMLHRAFPKGVRFEEGKGLCGVSLPSNYNVNSLESNDTLAKKSVGLGIGAYWNTLVKSINTYNGKDSPGNTEDPTKDKSKQGKTVIYKRYWEKKVDEKGETVYEKVKDYKRKNTTYNIIITDEKDKGANYRIIGWFTGKNTKDPQPTEDETQEK